jgi:protein-disulfide isomerase
MGGAVMLQRCRSRGLSIAAVALTGAAVLNACGAAHTVDRRGATSGNRQRARQVEAVRTRFAGIPQGGTVLGQPSAPLTLIEFGDLQCPFCRRFALQTLPTLLTRYVRRGQLRLDFRAVALVGPDSARAARAAIAAAAENRLWQFLDLFYANQGRENTGYVTNRFVYAIATQVPGLNAENVMRTRQADAVNTQLSENLALARQVGIPGTPTFLLGPTGGSMRRLILPSLDPPPIVAVIQRMLSRR